MYCHAIAILWMESSEWIVIEHELKLNNTDSTINQFLIDFLSVLSLCCYPLHLLLDHLFPLFLSIWSPPPPPLPFAFRKRKIYVQFCCVLIHLCIWHKRLIVGVNMKKWLSLVLILRQSFVHALKTLLTGTALAWRSANASRMQRFQRGALLAA